MKIFIRSGLFFFGLVVSIFAEEKSKVPLLASFSSPVPMTVSKQQLDDPEVVHLDNFVVSGQKIKALNLDSRFERIIEGEALRRSFERRRISLIPDAADLGQNLERFVPLGSRQSYLQAQDAFDLNLPWGGKIETQFHAKVQIKLRYGWEFILRLSRRNTVSFFNKF